MSKKITKTDILFLASLVIGALFLSIFLFAYPRFFDETFQTSVPFRFAVGDSLLQHEWHLSQFASLFSCFPIRFWLSANGSVDGIFVFLRCLYFVIHIITTVVIYLFFRKHEKWSVVAAMIFFTQTPYRIFNISYNSVYVLSTLFLCLCLITIYKKKSKHLYLLCGVFFACACVCNPLYCAAYAFYVLICILWKKREVFRAFVVKIKTQYITKRQKNIHQKQTNKLKQIDALPELESYGCFFSKDAFIYSFLGIAIIALIAVAYFFYTGGTISSVFKNIPNILSTSEYSLFSSSLLYKFKDTLYYFNELSFYLFIPTLLLLVFIAFDKKSKENSRRYIYLILSVIVQLIFIAGIYKTVDNVCFFSLPFLYFSTVCYMLTEKKNKLLFHCVCIPCAIAAIFKYLAANALLLSLGIVFAISNIAGVFFVKDLFYEISQSSSKSNKLNKAKALKALLCVGISIQMLVQCFVFMYEQTPSKDSVTATDGPFAGIYMTSQQHEEYNDILDDIETIKQYNKDNEPVLVITYNNWIHMCIDAPLAIYTTWRNTGNNDELQLYYQVNPERKPRYIYIDYSDDKLQINRDLANYNMELLSELFGFSVEELSHGLLLTVTAAKFELYNK